MRPPKTAGHGLTPVQREAQEFFKRSPSRLTDEQQTRKDFDDNRERLKAERLAHEAAERMKST